MSAPARPSLRSSAAQEPREAPRRAEPVILTLDPARPRPAARDWSNVVFSVAFCEQARREWELRNAS